MTADVYPDDRWRRFLHPSTIAVIGASERRQAGQILRALLGSAFTGTVVPVNPNRQEVLGLPCVASIADLRQTPDTVVIAVRRDRVPAELRAAARAGAAGAIIVTAGFGETDAEGKALERQIREVAAEFDVIVQGPNCLGMMALHEGTILYGGGSGTSKQPGSIALVSQSGGLSNAVYSAGARRGLDFSHVVSTGNETVNTAEDFLQVFIGDPRVRVILLVAETFRQPSRLAELARAARRAAKPVVVLKLGRSMLGRRMAHAHTGALVGGDGAQRAVFREYGFIEVDTISECLELADLLSRRRACGKPGVFAIGGSGGDTVLLADTAERNGVPLPEPSPAVQAAIRARLGDVHTTNPFELGRRFIMASGADPLDVLRVLTNPETSDIAMLRPRLSSGKEGGAAWTIADVARVAAETSTTVIVTSRGPDVEPSEWAATRREFPGLVFLHEFDSAFKAIKRLTEWQSWVDAAPAEDPVPLGPADERWDGTGSVEESLRRAGLPLAREREAHTVAQAEEAATDIGYPVAVKAATSAGVPHKSDAGLVHLDIRTPQAVRDAYARVSAELERLGTGPSAVVQEMVAGGVEVIVGAVRDPVFGPCVVLGAGGIFAELIKDTVIHPAPVSLATAQRMIAQTRIGAVLAGARGHEPYDVDALADLVARFSRFAAGLEPSVTAIDLNPVIVLPAGKGCRIVDSLVIRETVNTNGDV